MYHPSRGGVRGGRDQFNWEDVKADKHRENYLGHSVKAPVGRWQKGKDLYWYTKDHGSEGSTKEEIKRIQEEEEEAMKEMLGLAPRKNKRPRGNQLDKREVDELLKKGKDGDEQAPAYVDGERVEGLGFAPAPGQTGGQSGGKRAIQVTGNELPPEQINCGGLVKEVEKDLFQRMLPSSEAIATSPGVKGRQDGGFRGGEDEPGCGKKRQEEKGKAREMRREEKRARKKALIDAGGHRSNDGKTDSSRRGRHEDKGKRRHERMETSLDYHNLRMEGHEKAKYDEGNDSDGRGEKAGRLSTGHKNRRSSEYGSSSEGEPFKPYVKHKGSESPKQKDQKIRRQDADRGKKVDNSSTSRDDSAFIKRHRRVRKENSPIRRHQLERRQDSDNQAYVDRGKENRFKDRRDSPISRYQKQRKYDSDGDGYANGYKDEQRRREKKEELPFRRYEKQGRHDSDSEGHMHHRDEDQRRRGKKEKSPIGKYRSQRRQDSDSDEHINYYKQGHRNR